MSDEEEYSEEEVLQPGKQKEATMSHAELEKYLKKEIGEWRIQRGKEEEILRVLKEKQAKRRIQRAKEEKRLLAQRREEEKRRRQEIIEKAMREEEEIIWNRRIQETLRKKQEEERRCKEAAEGGDGKNFKIKKGQGAGHEPGTLREALAKSPEEYKYEKEMIVEFRCEPLDLEGKNEAEMKVIALALWDKIVTLVTETYDMADNGKSKDYDIKQLKERFKLKMKSKAMKMGLDPEAFIQKYPPKVNVAVKGERREDTRTFEEKLQLFDKDLPDIEKQMLEKFWKERLDLFNDRFKKKLPVWFGERPGKKKGEPDTPEEEPKVEEELSDFEEEEVVEEDEELEGIELI